MLSKQPFLPPIYIFKLWQTSWNVYIYIITYNDSMISKPIRGRCPDDNESLKWIDAKAKSQKAISGSPALKRMAKMAYLA